MNSNCKSEIWGRGGGGISLKIIVKPTLSLKQLYLLTMQYKTVTFVLAENCTHCIKTASVEAKVIVMFCEVIIVTIVKFNYSFLVHLYTTDINLNLNKTQVTERWQFWPT